MASKKYIDLLGLQEFLSMIKQSYSGAFSGLGTDGFKVNVSHIDTAIPSVSGVGGSKGLIAPSELEKLNGIASGAQVNVIESVTLDGVSQAISEKVMTLDLSAYAKKGEVVGGLNFKGSRTGAQLDALTASDVDNGDMYTCTEDGGVSFVFHEGYEYAAVLSGDPATLSWAELGKYIDLSGYVEKTQTINSKALSGNIVLSGADVNLSANYGLTSRTSPSFDVKRLMITTGDSEVEASISNPIGGSYFNLKDKVGYTFNVTYNGETYLSSLTRPIKPEELLFSVGNLGSSETENVSIWAMGNIGLLSHCLYGILSDIYARQVSPMIGSFVPPMWHTVDPRFLKDKTENDLPFVVFQEPGSECFRFIFVAEDVQEYDIEVRGQYDHSTGCRMKYTGHPEDASTDGIGGPYVDYALDSSIVSSISPAAGKTVKFTWNNVEYTKTWQAQQIPIQPGVYVEYFKVSDNDSSPTVNIFYSGAAPIEGVDNEVSYPSLVVQEPDTSGYGTVGSISFTLGPAAGAPQPGDNIDVAIGKMQAEISESIPDLIDTRVPYLIGSPDDEGKMLMVDSHGVLYLDDVTALLAEIRNLFN